MPEMASVDSVPRAGSVRNVPQEVVCYKNIHTLATLHDELGEITDAAIVVKGNEIAWVGKTADIPADFAAVDKTVDLAGCVVIPGMVNTHAHMFQSLTCCIAQDKQLYGWLKTLYPIWSLMTPDDLHTSTLLAMAELMLTGATSSSDHCYFFANGSKLDDTIRAARDVGLRFVAVRGSMSAGLSKGGIAPDSCVEAEPDILADSERCIKEFHDNSKFSMLRIALGPSSQKTVTNELMASSAVLARKYPGVRLHTHLAENQEDIVYTTKMYGYRFAEYIKSIGWDQKDCWFAHCCMLNEEEISLFAEKGIGVAHCPSSNTRLASGICPVRAMLDAGVNVGVGVDGAASNDSQNILAETRLALLLQRAGGNPKGLSAREAMYMATRGGARNLGREQEIGQIAPGFAADFVAWQMDGSLAFATSACIDPVAALLLCAPSSSPVHLSVINGEIVVENGKLTTIDMDALIAKARKAAKRLADAAVTKEAVGAGPYPIIVPK